jgi:phosphatidylglycerol lysyltransferase
MTKNVSSYLGPTIGAVIFLAALWVLHRELKLVHYPEIVDSVKQIPTARLMAALAATGLNYLVLTGYDWLAFRYIRRSLRYSRIALASFIGYAFSNSAGLSMLAGSSVRYRLYSAWGLSAREINKVVAFYTLTLWLGLFTVAGGVFIVKPVILPTWVHLPLASTRPLGCMLLLLLGIYLLSGIFKKKPLSVWGLEIPFPPIDLSLQQIALSGLDWLLAGSVLYILVGWSNELSFGSFLSIYLFGQISGLVSQVPGGLGVFESVITLGLSPFLPTPSVVASLLAYRLIYYLLPLLAATILLGSHELFEKRSALARGVYVLDRWIPHLAPRVFSFMVFIAGTILLLSGATPGVGWRMTLLRDLLPLSVVEMSHFLGSLIGVILLLVARGLQLRLDGAYFLTVVLLGAGMVASLLKGVDFEEATVLGVVLVALIPCRKYFYRKASLLNEPFTPGWIISVGAVLLTSLWITIFAHKHVDYSVDLWWTFAFSQIVPRAVRATLVAVIVCLVVALSRLLRPVVPRILSTLTDEEMQSIERLVHLSPNTSARLAFLGDKRFLFSRSRRSFIMYGVEGRSWVAMGDPVGERDEWQELAWQFREKCDRYGGWTVFYEVGKESLPLYLDLGLTLFKIGEEGIVPLQTFSLEGKSRKGFRNSCNRMEKEGYYFEIIEAQAVPSILPRLKVISDAWLREKHTREKRFSLGRFDPQYLERFPVGVVRKEQETLAFCNLWEGAAREELSVDLMRYSPDVPPETMDYLFIRLMLWGKEHGYQKFNLGMAPLSGLDSRSLAPTWSRLGALIYQHVEHFYNFKGLRQYKEKFDPVWEPRYMACPRGLILPRILTNIASLTSGGMKGVIAK